MHKAESTNISPLLSIVQLKAILPDDNVVIIDARSGPDAYERFSKEHIIGAVYVDLETELSHKGEDPSKGGRHPLPGIKAFAALLGKLGIEATSIVVVYDDKSGANAAARFWWMLKAAGHKSVQVLDGGLNAAKNDGIPVTNELKFPAPKSMYPVTQWQLPLADIDKVAEAASDPGQMVIDVREAYRYNGESEPIDFVAGHIPGAMNIPYTGNLDAEGKFLPADQLSKKYKEALKGTSPHNVIVHCGSGVTACHTLLAMKQAGISGSKLYVGSWSEWSRSDRPIATSK